MKRNYKALAMVLSAGTLFHVQGCLNLGGLGGLVGGLLPLLSTAAYNAAYEYVLDNDAVFDLFEDGNVTAAE